MQSCVSHVLVNMLWILKCDSLVSEPKIYKLPWELVVFGIMFTMSLSELRLKVG